METQSSRIALYCSKFFCKCSAKTGMLKIRERLMIDRCLNVNDANTTETGGKRYKPVT